MISTGAVYIKGGSFLDEDQNAETTLYWSWNILKCRATAGQMSARNHDECGNTRMCE